MSQKGGNWAPCFPGCPVLMYRKIVIPLLLVSVLACLLFPLHVLQVKAVRNGDVVFLCRVRPGVKLSLGYIHSVEHCPVWDHIKIDEQFHMVLHETVFSSSNTGLPAVLSMGERFSAEGGQFRISNMRRVLPAVTLWVDDKYENTLILGEEKILKLPSLAGNTLLEILIEKMTLIEFIYHKAKTMVD